MVHCSLVDVDIETIYAMPPKKTRMLLDYESGHLMGTEAIAGNAVRAAKRADRTYQALI